MDDGPIELSAEERQRQADRIRRANALQERLAAEEANERKEQRRERAQRRRRRVKPTIAVAAVVVVIGTVIVALPSGRTDRPESVVGGGLGFGDPVDWGSTVGDTSRPTPAPPDSNEPLGEPPALPTGSGDYSFLTLQPERDAAVAYDPCREIHYVTNTLHAPTGRQTVIADAIANVSEATGLVFVNDGTTQEPYSDNRAPFQPDLYGDQWAPVVIWWTTPEEASALTGDVVGFAGSASLQAVDDQGELSAVYVSGVVALDGPQLGDDIENPEVAAQVTAVVQHELGHLIGLDHVEDGHQLMAPSNTGQTDFADGDLRGLNELGRGRCFPEL